ncbi:C2 domain-containing protein [Egbenema bharatensis]|uniref:C2 domain-containing protein n=1 Tax=Egbenema bharatensis TaxID=3463334 RepID=UPI003A8BF9B7
MSNSQVNRLNPVNRLSTNVNQLQAANRSALEASTSIRSTQSTSTSYNFSGREREANNTAEEARRNNHIGDFTNNGSASYTGTVSSFDAMDMYAFTVNNSKNTVSLSLTNTNTRANETVIVSLMGADGRSVGAASILPGTASTHFQRAGLEAGTYYAAVFRPNTNTTNTINYSLGVSARESRKQLVLDVTNLKDTGELDNGGRPDWYAKVNMGGTRFQTQPIKWPTAWGGLGTIGAFSHNPNWSFTRDVPLTGGNPVNISLEVWDKDLIFDDQADINSGSGRGLDFRVDLQSGRVTSNDLRISAFNLGESKTTEGNDSNRNEITFKISTRYV